ncbi:MAG: VOC family protein [Terriglobales bacterium]
MSEISDEFPGPTPHVVAAGTDAAIRFYQEAFGADELIRNRTADGRIMHCELLLLGGRLLVADDFEADPVSSPARLGGTSVRLHLYVSDVDEIYARALATGATGLVEPYDAFWGDRYAMIRDPVGHLWSFGSGHDDLALAEVEGRADTWSQQHPT